VGNLRERVDRMVNFFSVYEFVISQPPEYQWAGCSNSNISQFS